MADTVPSVQSTAVDKALKAGFLHRAIVLMKETNNNAMSKKHI